jgi:hypothetical protein
MMLRRLLPLILMCFLLVVAISVGLAILASIRQCSHQQQHDWITTTALEKAPRSQPRLLLIIQGNYRTLDLTVDSILRNLCMVNGGCHIALSLANTPDVVSREVRLKLRPYLVAELYQETGDVREPHYIFEYHQTLKVFERVPLDPYQYVMRIRADCYVSVPVPVMSAIGEGPYFERDWTYFGSRLPHSMRHDIPTRLRAWFLTGGVPQLINKLATQKPPLMAWSPFNVLEFNEAFMAAIEQQTPKTGDAADPILMRPIVREVVARHRIVYMCGGLFLHFGTTRDMVTITQTAFDHWKKGPGETLNWKSEFPHSVKAQMWTAHVAQEANIRLAHKRTGHVLMDLHNAADYLVSFSWKYYGFSQLSQAKGLVIWLLRPRQVKFKQVPQLKSTRFWLPIDTLDYPNPVEGPGIRPPALTHGCLRESTPEEMADCFQDERDQ